MRLLACVVMVCAACGFPRPADVAEDAAPDAEQEIDAQQVVVDAAVDAPSGPCNVLTQMGCAANQKCTWIADTYMPTYTGHIGCAPVGNATAGQNCMFGPEGATGYDNCAKGLVCSNYRGGGGFCRAICDQMGGAPMCDASSVCSVYSGLFDGSGAGPALAGICNPACNPLTDNDFDGAGARTRMNTCGSANIGCYGYPSYGTPPATGFTCQNDINFTQQQPTGLRHRVQCTVDNNCAEPGPQIFINSCNQGYLPLMYEASGVNTIVCLALCRPANCYSGNCGTNNVNTRGLAGHTCSTADRIGTFNTAANGEHCTYFWLHEVDNNGNLLPSPSSDTVGFCWDHSKYRYDSNGDTQIDASDLTLPACSQLQLASSSTDPSMPLTYFGAKDLGCVDSALGTMATGKPSPLRRKLDIRPLYRPVYK